MFSNNKECPRLVIACYFFATLFIACPQISKTEIGIFRLYTPTLLDFPSWKTGEKAEIKSDGQERKSIGQMLEGCILLTCLYKKARDGLWKAMGQCRDGQ